MKDPAHDSLTRAFDALRVHDYDTAISLFEKAAALSPTRPDIRTNLAYTFLKTGDSEAAREQFGEAMHLDPSDLHLALEYAFLCFEARDNVPARKAEARRIFARVRDSSGPDALSRATASQAFANIDAPLAAGIARWQQVVATSQPTFSALYELAQLAEQRDNSDLAASSYKSAFQLRPERKSVLLELARAEKTRNNPEGAMAALLAASRGTEPRAAELAREQLPDRYPYVYEFRQAIDLDPTNVPLRHELDYLLQAMADKEQKEKARSDPPTNNVRALAEKSYAAGFLKDAKRYFLEAYEQSPLDASIALRLGWTSNLLHDDAQAVHWFDVARHSDDREISAEAQKAYENLHPAIERLRSTLWIYPLYSSRWHDLFGYGQLKTEIRLWKFPVHPYASLRFDGDVRDSIIGPPQNLSISSFILALGAATQPWRGAVGWFEAGTSMSYLGGGHSSDYRGGVSFSRTFGTSIAAEHSGWFVETLADSVFISRFDHDLINYSQNRAGFTSSFGAFKLQSYWSVDLTFDARSQYWANFFETGPGLRFHPPGSPRSLAITIGGFRGVYLHNEDNPRGPNFFDFRAGIWYALTK